MVMKCKIGDIVMAKPGLHAFYGSQGVVCSVDDGVVKDYDWLVMFDDLTYLVPMWDDELEPQKAGLTIQRAEKK